MLPGRLGLRFALEALFLVLLALGAGLAHLRPAYIVLVMAAGWILVAIVEFTAERITQAPLTYLLPRPEEPPDELEPSWPMPEERTVVAPPEQRPEAEPEPEPEPEPVAAPPVLEEPEPEALDEPEPDAEREQEEPPRARRFGFWRRRGNGEQEEPAEPPRHVKLLPRRTAPEPTRATQEVSELFDRPDDAEERSG